MKIGILQPGHAPDEVRGELGDYADMFERLLGGHDFSFQRWDVVDGIFPEGPLDAEAWLITGSRHGVYEGHDWIAPLEELIRQIAASGRPLVGVCFGHQIIAQALGGRVEKFAGGWAVGRQSYDFGGETLALNAWHQDQVVELPEGARVIASNNFCENAALVIGDNVLTIQPHPEFAAEMMKGLIDYRSGAVAPALVDEARASLAQSTDNAAMGARMAEFLLKGGK
ncbi:type 1 glutamine amidotransferase [Sinisalibacter aestuarii]|uniref:Glutamine amidotransferase n=1 Tax=Sinisalibacter aestuarii TaxID=2949426 RepID=A0ABQ5LWR3_9RHOB|nr:type 1 glutamine amidotransferase [Sinisalibacter aestuarii]GKY89412.1 glutamine amidotransferase [Sinisalibacter aestuarii]